MKNLKLPITIFMKLFLGIRKCDCLPLVEMKSGESREDCLMDSLLRVTTLVSPSVCLQETDRIWNPKFGFSRNKEESPSAPITVENYYK